MTPTLVLAAGLLAAPPEPPAARTFTLTYAAEVAGLPAGGKVRVWVPQPPQLPEQTVAEDAAARSLPGFVRTAREAEYGNEAAYLEPTADATGVVKLSQTYTVIRRPDRRRAAGDEQVARLLQPDRLVPVGGKPVTLLAGKDLPADPAAKARALYDVVADHMRYDKGVPGWGRGDAAWACDSRAGNCSDFHSLFISLARSQGLPARFEVGFGLPLDKGKGEIGGYHCWARVLAGGQWLPVDISEENKLRQPRGTLFGELPPNRVTFGVGRDVVPDPKPAGGPLNFFVSPHVEVGDKPHPADKVKVTVIYADR